MRAGHTDHPDPCDGHARTRALSQSTSLTTTATTTARCHRFTLRFVIEPFQCVDRILAPQQEIDKLIESYMQLNYSSYTHYESKQNFRDCDICDQRTDVKNFSKCSANRREKRFKMN